MTDLIPIPHQGRKPDWLEDDAMLSLWDEGPAHRDLQTPAGEIYWHICVNAGLYLHADHWAAPVLRAGLTPWNPTLQGYHAPENWDRAGRVMLDNGQMVQAAYFKSWSSQIIGYEPAPAIEERP